MYEKRMQKSIKIVFKREGNGYERVIEEVNMSKVH
jgi:hypothetical protein